MAHDTASKTGRAADARRPGAEEIFGPAMTRRGFLKGTAGGTLVLGAASLLPAGCADYPAAPPDLKVFNAKEYAIINAAAPAYLGVDPATEGVDVAKFFDGLAENFPPQILDLIKQGLAVFEHATLLFCFSLKSFTQMDLEARTSYAESWATSGLGFRRALNIAVRSICLAGYYLQPATWKEIHYDGPWLGRVEVPQVVQRFPLDEGSVKT
ncbi:MAG: twin-arginine translocation signal domain-containing protein [Deltaproteobacteria bacterium]|nr:twin-arginine translocation signal domain-containing protein [Deltaproteobacteria bacterium]